MYAIITQDGDIVAYQDSPAVIAKGRRCLPVADVKPVPADGEVLDGPTVTVTDTDVVRTWVARPPSYDEKLAAVQAARRAAYPPVGDQLDAAYKARNGDPAPLAAVDGAIAAVKTAHPKPAAA